MAEATVGERGEVEKTPPEVGEDASLPDEGDDDSNDDEVRSAS